ncbi:hypothetical protein [Frankia sp. CiP3]|uniref:hypothetical protein n=1 Tax=Frankia sp. CiP3 TaxID=2880971 RepID=UPI001EF3F948|nr:hypothetical protein [Frankia sp. CiP3]
MGVSFSSVVRDVPDDEPVRDDADVVTPVAPPAGTALAARPTPEILPDPVVAGGAAAAVGRVTGRPVAAALAAGPAADGCGAPGTKGRAGLCRSAGASGSAAGSGRSAPARGRSGCSPVRLLVCADEPPTRGRTLDDARGGILVSGISRGIRRSRIADGAFCARVPSSCEPDAAAEPRAGAEPAAVPEPRPDFESGFVPDPDSGPGTVPGPGALP